jgi:hypothetical protein
MESAPARLSRSVSPDAAQVQATSVRNKKIILAGSFMFSDYANPGKKLSWKINIAGDTIL